MVGVVCGLIILYCAYLILFRRSKLCYERPMRWLNLAAGPLIYLTIILASSAYIREFTIVVFSICFGGACLGIWRASTVKFNYNKESRILQVNNWTGLIPIILIVSVYSINQLIGYYAPSVNVEKSPVFILWGMFLSSIFFSFIVVFRFVRFRYMHIASPLV